MAHGPAKQQNALIDENGDPLGTPTNPLRVDTTNDTPQEVLATSLPLPTGAATEATLATRAADRTNANAPLSARLSDGSAFYDAAKSSQLPSALAGGKLDVNTGTWLGSSAPTVGQKDGGSSVPVVIASDQSRLPFKTEQQLDYDTGAGVQQLSVMGLGLPASGGVVAGGTSTNPVRMDPTGTTPQPVTSAAGSQADGHSANIGALADPDTASTLTGLLKKIKGLLSGGLPSALVGGKLDINLGTWFGSALPTIGQKNAANSIPVVLPNDQTVPTSSSATEEATFSAVATAVVLGSGKSLLALYNPPSPNTKLLKLREYYVRNAQLAAVTGVAAQLEIHRFTMVAAPTGGSAIASSAHDTTDTIVAGADIGTGRTITGEEASSLDLMRLSSDEWGPGTLDQEGAQQTISNYLPARVKRDSAQKPLCVLRPGQGVHLKCVTATTAGSFDVIFLFTQV